MSIRCRCEDGRYARMGRHQVRQRTGQRTFPDEIDTIDDVGGEDRIAVVDCHQHGADHYRYLKAAYDHILAASDGQRSLNSDLSQTP